MANQQISDFQLNIKNSHLKKLKKRQYPVWKKFLLEWGRALF